MPTATLKHMFFPALACLGIVGSFIVSLSLHPSPVVATTGDVVINGVSGSFTGNLNIGGKILEDGSEIFANLISVFATSCPTGWTEYTNARGRFVTGTPSGGTIGGTVGTSALTNLENRTHTHSAGYTTLTTNQIPAHQHWGPTIAAGTTWLAPYYGVVYAYSNGANYYANPTTDFGGGTGGAHTHTTSSTSGGDFIPYIQLVYCQKNVGSDYAEWFPTNQTLDPGTIVSLSASDPGKIEKTARPYDSRIAGIISTSPGWTVGQEKSNSVQLALSGQVPVQVSLANGTIQVGDPITSSAIPGVGMKATDSGFILGRAMQPLTYDSPLSLCPGDKNQKCATITVLSHLGWHTPPSPSLFDIIKRLDDQENRLNQLELKLNDLQSANKP